jgi:molecular chaperone GrpE
MAEYDRPANDDSLEAANAIPGVQDDLEDNEWERKPIDLDAPVAPAVLNTDVPTAATIDADFDDNAPTDAAPQVSAKELDDLRAQLQAANESHLRARADLQNFRKRTDDAQRRLVQDANERLIKELLPVLDDFDLALDAARKTESYEQLIGGVSAVSRKFLSTLNKQGVEPIPAVGEPFDAELHEAVMLDEDSDEPDETVTTELRKGYTLHDRVIRPSLVKVAKKG